MSAPGPALHLLYVRMCPSLRAASSRPWFLTPWLLWVVPVLVACGDTGAFVARAPNLVSTVPAEGARGVALTASLSLVFSEPVRRDTLVLHSEPALPPGKLEWGAEDTSVAFVPSLPLAPSTHYTVEVEAVGAGGYLLWGQRSLSFETGPALERDTFVLTRSSPANGATGVSPTGDVLLSFSRPVDLAALSLKLHPRGELVSTAIEEDGRTLRCVPREPLAARTDFDLVIRARSVDGALLAEPTRIHFTTGPAQPTVRPTVVATTPTDGMRLVLVTTAISVGFSEVMDKASVEGAMGFTPSIACAGRWKWNPQGTGMSCLPPSPLAFDTAYQVTIADRAKNASGVTLAAPAVFRFTTVPNGPPPPPSVVEVSPGQGATGVPREGAVQLGFSEPMDAAATQEAFRITSPAGVTGSFSWSSDGSGVTFLPATPFAYGEEVTWALAASAKSQAGRALGTAVQGSFRVVRFSTLRVGSTPSLDGVVSSNGTVDVSASSVRVGDGANNVRHYGFFSFDLSAVPANVSALVSATLGIYQDGAEGVPYLKLGALRAEHVYYDGLDAADFAAATLGDLGYRLSVEPTAGYKVADVLPKVRDDLAQRAARSNRSQFRVRFNLAVPDDKADYATLRMSESSANRPYLDLGYEHP